MKWGSFLSYINWTKVILVTVQRSELNLILFTKDIYVIYSIIYWTGSKKNTLQSLLRNCDF